ncbi:hypothetical protein Aduo_011328 [Ancylostoma duodenale]
MESAVLSSMMFQTVYFRTSSPIVRKLVHDVPSSPLSYIFAYCRKTRTPDVFSYRCQHCRMMGKYTAVNDAVCLGHTCEGVERTKDKANRISYEVKSQNVVEYFVRGERGYERRRKTFSRAEQGPGPTPNMDKVPDHLRLRPDESTFLHVEMSQLRIYYSLNVVKKAVETGLFALVADGIHQMRSRSKRGLSVKMEEGQLYTIHGVGDGKIEAPLLYAICRHKREEGYLIVFGEMKKAIQLSFQNQRQSPNFEKCWNFETTAINTATCVFSRYSIKGWHLFQAWVRSRNKAGLLKFLTCEHKEEHVMRWWRTLKGSPFLPREYLHSVDVLRTPPGGSLTCGAKKTIRNYHWRLRQMFTREKYPELESLVLHLRIVTAVAMVRLTRTDEVEEAKRYLRRRDRERWQKVMETMSSFEVIRSGPNVTADQMADHLRKMSRSTSDRAI